MPSPSGAIVKGWIYKHKRGAKSSKFQKRYAVYELETGFFNYYLDEEQTVPKGRTTVSYAVPRFSIKAGEVACEFTFRSDETKFYDVIVESTEIRDMWIEVACQTVPPTPNPRAGTHTTLAHALATAGSGDWKWPLNRGTRGAGGGSVS